MATGPSIKPKTTGKIQLTSIVVVQPMAKVVVVGPILCQETTRITLMMQINKVLKLLVVPPVWLWVNKT